MKGNSKIRDEGKIDEESSLENEMSTEAAGLQAGHSQYMVKTFFIFRFIHVIFYYKLKCNNTLSKAENTKM